jgi:hypothetical protein
MNNNNESGVSPTPHSTTFCELVVFKKKLEKLEIPRREDESEDVGSFLYLLDKIWVGRRGHSFVFSDGQ